MADPYIPPAGNQVPLELGPAYTPPAGNSVPLEFVRGGGGPKPEQYLFPGGWESLTLGAHSVSNWTQYAQPAGWASQAFGGHSIANKARLLQAAGWGSQAFGATLIRNVSQGIFVPSIQAGVRFGTAWASLWVRTLQARGWQSDLHGLARIYNLKQTIGQAGNIRSKLAFGSAQILNLDRTVKPVGLPSNVWGTAAISHTERTIKPASIPAPGIGTAWVSFGQRRITPVGIYSMATGLPKVGGTRYLRPEGFDASRFGTRIIPESQSIYPLGWAELWGTPTVRNARFVVQPKGFIYSDSEAGRFGQHTAYNLRQYLRPFHDERSEAIGEQFGIWNQIKNRNRIVGAIGFDSSALPRPYIENKARVVQPVGRNSSIFGNAFISHGVRRIFPDAIEAPYIGPWNIVLNTARLLHPRGFTTGSWGEHALANTRRYFNRVGNWDSLAMGQPFVSFARREITFEERYAIRPPAIPLPTVGLRTRYIEAAGAGEQSGYGNAYLEIHWSKLYPRMGDMARYGMPTLRNVTPELLAWGRNHEEFGTPTLMNYKQFLRPVGIAEPVPGRPQIRDKRSWIYPGSQDFAVVSNQATIQNLRPDPPMTQRVYPLGWFSQAMGAPNLNQQVIYPSSAMPMTLWGETTVRQNVVQPVGIYDFFAIGTPWVSLRVRTLAPAGIASTLAVGKPRLNPHTIWATTDATSQAVDNHGGVRFYPVDFPPNGAALQGVGTPLVRLSYDKITGAGGSQHSAFGMPALSLRRQYIRPNGWRLSRFGWPEVPERVRYIRQFAGSRFDAFGMATIKPGPYLGPQTVRPQGIAGEFGQARIEHFNRELRLSGWDSAALGASGSGPRYMRQRLWVGAPDWPQMQGFDASEFGQPWISLKVREVNPEGWDSFLMEYDPKNFDQRMRVKRPTPPARVVQPRGWAAERLGVGTVKLGQHFIRPDGNADMFRKGAW